MISTRRTILLLILGVLTPGIDSAAGQDPQSSVTSTPQDAKTAAENDQSAIEADEEAIPGPVKPLSVDSNYVYLLGPDNKLIKVLAKSSMKEFMNWVEDRDDPKDDAQPKYGISLLELTGVAENEQAAIRIRIELSLTVEDRWVRIPLNLQEAVIRDARYEGEGDAIPDQLGENPVPRLPGYVWWFRGKGKHVLELDTLVPLVVQSPTRRMQLTIPQAAFRSMVLTVPYSRFQVKLPDESTSLVKIIPDLDGEQRAQIELVGLDPQLDISWQPAPETQPVDLVLQSAVAMELDFTGETVLLHARQQVQALQGTFDKVSVHLPPEFELLDVEGEKYRKHESPADQPRNVVVSLSEPTSGPIVLNWTLQTVFPARGVPLTIEGFGVDSAQRQTGEVLIRAVEGYRIHRREGEDQFIHRINVSDTDLSEKFSSAYRFLKQPFRLALNVQQEEPYFLATPEMLSHVSADQFELQCRFRFQVYRGAVSNVVIRWPHAVQEGWAVDPVQTPGLIESVTMSEEDAESRWLVKFVDRKTGNFEIALNARRKIVSDGTNQAWHLPLVEAPSQAPTLLTWILAEDVESELRPGADTTLRSVPGTLSSKIEIPMEWSTLRRILWRIDSAEQVLDVAVTKFPQLVETETTVEPDIGEDLIAVSQRLTYDVSYERISSLRVTLPADLTPRPRFFLEDGRPLTPIWTEDENSRIVSGRLDLPEPRLKRFEIRARYLVPVSRGSDAQAPTVVSLPIIQSADAAFKFTQLNLGQQSIWEVALEDGRWQSEVAAEGHLAYRANGAQTQVPLTIQRRRGERVRMMTIPRAVVRTQFEPDGSSLTFVQYLIEGGGREIDMQLPKDMELINAWKDQAPIDFDEVKNPTPEGILYRFSLIASPGSIESTSATPATPVNAPATASAASEESPKSVAPMRSAPGVVTLTLELHSRSSSAFDWVDRQRMTMPSIATDALIQQTIWQVIVPGEQHLATYPSGMSPLFNWQMTTRGWQRETLGEWSDATKWLDGIDVLPPLPAGFEQGNAYVFSRFGEIDVVSFRTMHRSLLVLIGAGISLLGCAIWLNVPGMRHPYTILIIAAFASLTALWYETVVLLLIQPLMGGILLAMLAFAIDRRFRPESTATMVTLGSTNEFMLPVSSVVRTVSPSVGYSSNGGEHNAAEQLVTPAAGSVSGAVGSEDPTTLRPAVPSSYRESVSIVDSGSRI
ncbi:MAG: hypothetical protein ACKVT0_23210 [Planctomycetaceae bacterium]